MTMLNYIDGLTIKSVNIKSKDINSIEDLYDFVHFRNKNKGHRSSIKCETFDQGKLFIIYYTKPQNKKNTIMTTLNYGGIEIVTFGSACIIETSVSSTGFPKLEDIIKTTKTHADFTKAEDEEDDAEEEDDDADIILCDVLCDVLCYFSSSSSFCFYGVSVFCYTILREE